MKLLAYLTILFFATIYIGTCSSTRRQLQTRVNNGRTADRKDYPFMARLIVSNDQKAFGCSGTLISKRHILTAAHCLFDCGAKQCLTNIIVELGSVHITNPDPNRKSYYVPRNKAIIHEKFDIKSTPSGNDIAIVPLPQDIEFTDYIKPAKLPKLKHSTLTNKNVKTAGWGMTQHGPGSEILLQTDIRILPNEECNMFTYNNDEENQHLCLKGKNTRTCAGDSGSPYIIEEKKLIGKVEIPWTIVGFNTDGLGDCIHFNPEAGINVKHYLTWISAKTGIKIIKY